MISSRRLFADSLVRCSLGLCLVACVTTQRKSEERPESVDEVVQQHADRLLQPFHNGETVLCRELSVVVNAAFHHLLVYPAGGRKTTGDGYVQIDWNQDETITTRRGRSRGSQRSGRRPLAKFRLMIGTTHFIVDAAVRVRKLMDASPTLTVTAAGHVFVTKNGSDAKKYEELHFENGTVRPR